jgi:hypothetical protein
MFDAWNDRITGLDSSAGDSGGIAMGTVTYGGTLASVGDEVTEPIRA